MREDDRGCCVLSGSQHREMEASGTVGGHGRLTFLPGSHVHPCLISRGNEQPSARYSPTYCQPPVMSTETLVCAHVDFAEEK